MNLFQIKKFTLLTTLAVALTSSSVQALQCSNKNLTVHHQHNEGPRGTDITSLVFKDGTEYEFLSKNGTHTDLGRKGCFDTYKVSHQFSQSKPDIKVHMHIFYAEGVYRCGGLTNTSMELEINIDGKNSYEKLSCDSSFLKGLNEGLNFGDHIQCYKPYYRDTDLILSPHIVQLEVKFPPAPYRSNNLINYTVSVINNTRSSFVAHYSSSISQKKYLRNGVTHDLKLTKDLSTWAGSGQLEMPPSLHFTEFYTSLQTYTLKGLTGIPHMGDIEEVSFSASNCKHL